MNKLFALAAVTVFVGFASTSAMAHDSRYDVEPGFGKPAAGMAHVIASPLDTTSRGLRRYGGPVGTVASVPVEVGSTALKGAGFVAGTAVNVVGGVITPPLRAVGIIEKDAVIGSSPCPDGARADFYEALAAMPKDKRGQCGTYVYDPYDSNPLGSNGGVPVVEEVVVVEEPVVITHEPPYNPADYRK